MKGSNDAPGTFRQSFRRHCSQSCAYSDETTWHPRWWRIPLENPWKCHFGDSKFQNVARCHGPQELVPWCEFQSRLQFIIICLLLKNFLTALQSSHCQVHVGFRCLYHCLLHSKKYSFLMSVDEIIFDIFSKFGLGAQVLSLNGFFLLILKESHGGKNLSYVTMLLICFWFLNYVDTFTHCQMTAYFLKNLTQLRVYWTSEW